ncbi:RtcB family protein [Thermospira aquatica]|uniref:3'-phosphate/5'-hydroxy nucleic acid ligase n=1 Tax=Thermospira aquatica TaxID=2828656 RepID=A0AAX3BCS7_9SPIR|nr:RtcB family protein [Thermospira aquatica]URA10112.1 RtcB family protein [Thermospira aquatica]
MKLRGQFTDADILIRDIDDATRAQIKTLVDCPAFAGNKIIIMPDCHSGKGSVIGFTMKLGDLVIPNIIGVDIGCGIEIYRIKTDHIDFEKLDRFIRHRIPSGFERRNHNPLAGSYEENYYTSKLEKQIEKICNKIGLDPSVAFFSIGTLGGGNHFLEIDQDERGGFWLSLHSGSRHFGLQIAAYHQKRARQWISQHEKGWHFRDLEYLPLGQGGEEYLEDMRVAQKYAEINRRTMTRILLEEFFHQDINETESIKSVHNYIDFDDGIIRKGAIRAHDGERLVVPLNMRDGVVIGRGKGRKDWNLSAPHGAGRRMSRHQAKKQLSLEEFRKSMEGIWSSTVNVHTIDEAPMAYKPSKLILESLSENVDIEQIIKPVYNFKAVE